MLGFDTDLAVLAVTAAFSSCLCRPLSFSWGSCLGVALASTGALLLSVLHAPVLLIR